jgi:hypothetical protein
MQVQVDILNVGATCLLFSIRSAPLPKGNIADRRCPTGAFFASVHLRVAYGCAKIVPTQRYKATGTINTKQYPQGVFALGIVYMGKGIDTRLLIVGKLIAHTIYNARCACCCGYLARVQYI